MAYNIINVSLYSFRSLFPRSFSFFFWRELFPVPFHEVQFRAIGKSNLKSSHRFHEHHDFWQTEHRRRGVRKGGVAGRLGTTSTRLCDPSADPDWSNAKSLGADYVMCAE